MVAQYCVTMTARLLVLPWVLSGKCACCELKTHKKNKTASEVSALSSGQSGHCPECTPPHTQRYWDRLQSPPVTSNETRWEMRNCLMFFFFLLYLEINLILTSLQSGDPQWKITVFAFIDAASDEDRIKSGGWCMYESASQDLKDRVASRDQLRMTRLNLSPVYEVAPLLHMHPAGRSNNLVKLRKKKRI